MDENEEEIGEVSDAKVTEQMEKGRNWIEEAR